MQVDDVHHTSLNQSNYDPEEVPRATMQTSQNLSVLLTIRTGNTRQKTLPHHPAPLAVAKTVIAASAAATMNIMYSLLTYPHIA